MKQKVSSGSPWEDIVGYSRAIRVGNTIEVAGTTAMDGDVLIGKDDVYAQTKFIILKTGHSSSATLYLFIKLSTEGKYLINHGGNSLKGAAY